MTVSETEVTDEMPARPAALSDQVVVAKSALDWLNGEAPDADGKWFGEWEEAAKAAPLAGKYPRTYWWRSKFRAMIAAAPASTSGEVGR